MSGPSAKRSRPGPMRVDAMDQVGIDFHKAVPGGIGSRSHRRRPGLRADVRDEEAPREDGRAGCASAAITETCRPGSGQASGTRAGLGLTGRFSRRRSVGSSTRCSMNTQGSSPTVHASWPDGGWSMAQQGPWQREATGRVNLAAPARSLAARHGPGIGVCSSSEARLPCRTVAGTGARAVRPRVEEFRPGTPRRIPRSLRPVDWSGKPDSNRRPSAWEAITLRV